MQHNPEITEGPEGIRLGNGLVEFVFSPALNGALISIVDGESGWQLVRDPEAPRVLWRLALRRTAGQEVEWLESPQATGFSWSAEDRDGQATLVLTATVPLPTGPVSGLLSPVLSVTVRVSLAAGSRMSTWRMEVSGIGEGLAVQQILCPLLSGLVKLGDPAPGETLLAPVQGEGYLFRNPFPVRDRLPLCAGAGPEAPDVGVGRTGGRYPGAIALQMYALYNDHAGLYFATHDSGQHPKDFSMGPLPGLGQSPVLAVGHRVPEIPGADVAIAYDTVVGVFHGDWYDAANRYKAWATKQWWCEKKLWERDIAEWMRKGVGGVFQMSNYHIPKLDLNHSMEQIADTVNALSAEAGVPLLGLVFNFEGGGGWTGPAGLFPPREGEEAFRDAMRRLREAGNYGFVYIPGGNWYVKIAYEPPFDSWPQFEEQGRPIAARDAGGEVPIQTWYPGWEVAKICPRPGGSVDLHAAMVLGCLDLCCPAVQIDNFPCGGTQECYDAEHGHPPGFGAWWAEDWCRLLAEVRRQARAKEPDCVLSTEGVSEGFIPWLDLFDHRSSNMEWFGHYGRGMPMGGETVPLFNYVYSGYIGAYSAAYLECNRPEVLYWTRAIGKALAHGVLPSGGRYFPDPPENNPVTIGFYKKVVRTVGRVGWPYLMFGEMLRPPRIDVPETTAHYCKWNYIATPERMEHRIDPGQRHEVRDAAVQHSAFRGRDGSIATFLANISEEPVSFYLDVSAYGAEGAFDVRRVVDGGDAEPWLRGVALPRRERISLPALSVLTLIVEPAKG